MLFATHVQSLQLPMDSRLPQVLRFGELAEKALHGIRPVRIESVLMTPQLSTSTYPEKVFADVEKAQCYAQNAQPWLLTGVEVLATAGSLELVVAGSGVGIVFPPANLVPTAIAATGATMVFIGIAVAFTC